MKNKPYHLLLPTGILFFISGMFRGNTTIDLHLHDTYFVFPYMLYAWFPATVLIGFWIIYLLTHRFLFSKKLIWIHIILIITACTVPLILPYIPITADHAFAGRPRRYYDYEGMNKFTLFKTWISLFTVYFILFPMATLVYIVNLLIGMYKVITNKRILIRQL